MYKRIFLSVFMVCWFGMIYAQADDAHDIYGARGVVQADQHEDTTPSHADKHALSQQSGWLFLLNEGFADITTLPGSGWHQVNNSDPIGTSNWFQGNVTLFPAYDGPEDAYIGANFNNTSGSGTISNWLITPVRTIVDGNEFRFWTRTTPGTSNLPDRLQLRMSVNGSSTNVGTSAISVGDFTTLLLDINESYDLGGYPGVWTQYTVVVSDVPVAVQGRFALRYFVEDGGPSVSRSNYIGIDRVQYVRPTSLVPVSGWSVMLSLFLIAGFSFLFVRRLS